MKKIIILFSISAICLLHFGCGQKSHQQAAAKEEAPATTSATDNANPSYDPNRGEGCLLYTSRCV